MNCTGITQSAYREAVRHGQDIPFTCPPLPKPTSVARAANRHRSKNRLKHPTTLDFELLHDHVPSQFLRSDVYKNGTRHLIFATDAQLELLSNAKHFSQADEFQTLHTASHDPRVAQHLLYMERQWISSTTT